MSNPSKTRSIVYVGMTVALLAVSAWVAIPLGPVPFTLQTFVLTFALLVLRPGECFAALCAYLALGAIGVPVFSGMRGGLGMLVGPTGGFLWGFVLGAVVAFLMLILVKRKILVARQSGAVHAGRRVETVGELAACVAFLLVSYLCGWVQLMLVAGLSPLAAFLAAIAPFVVPDIVKLVAAVAVARAVRKAVPSIRRRKDCSNPS